MSLTSRVTNLFSTSTDNQQGRNDIGFADDGLSGGKQTFPNVNLGSQALEAENMTPGTFDEEPRPPYLHCMIAGGLGGTTGDLLMHSLDTVKTRQQGDPHIPPKYSSMSNTYATILRQEGIRRGLYGGWVPALLGSFPGTIIFFGTYEFSKRNLVDYGVPSTLAHFSSGFVADGAASILYVPSEVLKTRLQLQGRYNNPYFKSGYNYKSFRHATRTIVRQEGFSALFSGYGATLWRDLPFSALQFAFYEQAQVWAKQWKQSKDIGLPLELSTGAAAGGLAGVITCPLDVVKTRIQTQINHPMTIPVQKSHLSATPLSQQQTRTISTSSPSTHTPRPGAVKLDTSNILTGMNLIYKSEGVGGLFRGVGPRFVWTSVQSGCMLFLYQYILKQLEGISSRNELESVV